MELLEQTGPWGGSKSEGFSLTRPSAGRLRALPKQMK
jgi:hypothetical protein